MHVSLWLWRTMAQHVDLSMLVAYVHEEGADCMAHPSRVHALRGEMALHFRHMHTCIQWQLIPPVVAHNGAMRRVDLSMSVTDGERTPHALRRWCEQNVYTQHGQHPA